MARQSGGRISKRAIIRDPRGAQAAKFTKDIAETGSKMYDQATKSSLAKKLGMKVLTKESLAESQAYRDLAKDIAKVNPSLDRQIIAEIENNARKISDAYMKAYGPDGTPEDMITFQTLDNDLTGQLNDLTMAIGAMDADLEAYDLAKEEDRLIGAYDDDKDLFKYGITSGDSDVLLSKDENGKYILKGRNPAGSQNEHTIVIGDYAENLRKKGTGGWKSINPNMEAQTIEFGKSIGNALKKKIDIKYDGIKGGKIENPNFDKNQPSSNDNPEFITAQESFTFTDPDKAKEVISGYLNTNMGNGFRNLTGSGSVPSEEELWEFLKREKVLNDSDPWDKSKQAVLNKAYTEFIVNDIFPTGKSNLTVAGSGKKTGILNSNDSNE
jgi:hypothetical protein